MKSQAKEATKIMLSPAQYQVDSIRIESQKNLEANRVYKGYVTSKWLLGMAAAVTAVGLLAIFGCNIPGGCHLDFLKDFSNIAQTQLGNTALIGITSGVGTLGTIAFTNMIITKYFKKTEIDRGRLNSGLRSIFNNKKLKNKPEIKKHLQSLSSEQKEKVKKKAESLKKLKLITNDPEGTSSKILNFITTECTPKV